MGYPQYPTNNNLALLKKEKYSNLGKGIQALANMASQYYQGQYQDNQRRVAGETLNKPISQPGTSVPLNPSMQFRPGMLDVNKQAPVPMSMQYRQPTQEEIFGRAIQMMGGNPQEREVANNIISMINQQANHKKTLSDITESEARAKYYNTRGAGTTAGIPTEGKPFLVGDKYYQQGIDGNYVNFEDKPFKTPEEIEYEKQKRTEGIEQGVLKTNDERKYKEAIKPPAGIAGYRENLKLMNENNAAAKGYAEQYKKLDVSPNRTDNLQNTLNLISANLKSAQSKAEYYMDVVKKYEQANSKYFGHLNSGSKFKILSTE